eukprot:jgi/Botrbrau1/7932/Bobra.9_2s0092.1
MTNCSWHTGTLRINNINQAIMMQHSLSQVAGRAGLCGHQRSNTNDRLRLLHPGVHGPQRSDRSTALEVCAAKGMGKKRLAQQQGMGMGPPPTPPVDPENVEFVIFVRAKKFPTWYPLSIVKGGNAANLLVRAMESEWGRKLYGKTLIRNIGQAVYKDKKKIEAQLKATPSLGGFSDFEYGFKIRDKEVPSSWYAADYVTPFPPESELKGTVADNIQAFFNNAFKGSATA